MKVTQKLWLGLLAGVAAVTAMSFGCAIAQAQGYTPRQTEEGQPVLTDSGKPAYNIIFVISDQRTYRLFAGQDYSLPAIDAVARHGVTFRNHYTPVQVAISRRLIPPPPTNSIYQKQWAFTLPASLQESLYA